MEPAAVQSNRLIVDIQNPGKVTVAVLNTEDDVMGDYWVAYETDPDNAHRIGEGLISKAAEARGTDADPPATPLKNLATRLRAFGRDCVHHGDMTPGAERMLARILDEALSA